MKIRLSFKLFTASAFLGMALILCGCPTTRSHYFPQPERLSIHGPYLHLASGIALPEAVGDFRRDLTLRYVADGTDISAGYTNSNPLPVIAATVYVYPSPKLVSIGSPPDVIAGARARLAANEFELRKREIFQAHPGASLVDQRDVIQNQRGQTYSGKLAVFDYSDAAGTSHRAYLYLFSYVDGKWTVKYRFTHPKIIDAKKEVQDFVQQLKW